MAPGGGCPLLAVPYRWLPPAIALQSHSAAFDGQQRGEPGSINPGETPAGTAPWTGTRLAQPWQVIKTTRLLA